jgi:hypothetical protein
VRACGDVGLPVSIPCRASRPTSATLHPSCSIPPRSAVRGYDHFDVCTQNCRRLSAPKSFMFAPLCVARSYAVIVLPNTSARYSSKETTRTQTRPSPPRPLCDRPQAAWTLATEGMLVGGFAQLPIKARAQRLPVCPLALAQAAPRRLASRTSTPLASLAIRARWPTARSAT